MAHQRYDNYHFLSGMRTSPIFYPPISLQNSSNINLAPNLSFNGNPDNHIMYDYTVSGCYDCDDELDFKIPYQDPTNTMNFQSQILVSNILLPTCIKIDPNLIVPWGMIILNDIIWVANFGSGLITSYNLRGDPLNFKFQVFGSMGNISQPTGLVFNTNTNCFLINKGPIRDFSNIIVVTKNGTIHGYNSSVDPCNSIMLYDATLKNSVYTGIAIKNSIHRNENFMFNNLIYVTDFFNRQIDVFDCNMNNIKNFPFIDDNMLEPIPINFAPYNITSIGDFLYVTYARQNPNNPQCALCGVGEGYINMFTWDGRIVRRFASCGPLNAPWGMVLAPSLFGYPAGSIMVANSGNGIINVFDACGNYLTNLKDRNGNDIYIENIKGFTFNSKFCKILYWASHVGITTTSFLGTIFSDK